MRYSSIDERNKILQSEDQDIVREQLSNTVKAGEFYQIANQMYNYPSHPGPKITDPVDKIIKQNTGLKNSYFTIEQLQAILSDGRPHWIDEFICLTPQRALFHEIYARLMVDYGLGEKEAKDNVNKIYKDLTKVGSGWRAVEDKLERKIGTDNPASLEEILEVKQTIRNAVSDFVDKKLQTHEPIKADNKLQILHGGPAVGKSKIRSDLASNDNPLIIDFDSYRDLCATPKEIIKANNSGDHSMITLTTSEAYQLKELILSKSLSTSRNILYDGVTIDLDYLGKCDPEEISFTVVDVPIHVSANRAESRGFNQERMTSKNFLLTKNIEISKNLAKNIQNIAKKANNIIPYKIDIYSNYHKDPENNSGPEKIVEKNLDSNEITILNPRKFAEMLAKKDLNKYGNDVSEIYRSNEPGKYIFHPKNLDKVLKDFVTEMNSIGLSCVDINGQKLPGANNDNLRARVATRLERETFPDWKSKKLFAEQASQSVR